MDVPHIQTVWERDDVKIPEGTVSLNLFPSNRDIGLLIRDLVIRYGWLDSGVAILYESYDGKSITDINNTSSITVLTDLADLIFSCPKQQYL